MTRIPGTFKNRPPAPRRDLSPQGHQAEALVEAIGALSAQRYLIGDCTVMAAREPLGKDREHIWHVSIAHPSRYPTWDEIKTAVYGIEAIRLRDGRTFAQLLGPVAAGEWVNTHENCFHLYEIEDPLR